VLCSRGRELYIGKHSVWCQTEEFLMNNELDLVWKEEIEAYFKVLSRYSPGSFEENHIKRAQNRLFLDKI
jgi:hypothetical protein